jgi:lipopolysaccharide export system protein LptA
MIRLYILGLIFFINIDCFAKNIKNSNPIVINSDNLEVDREKEIAIFIGNVDIKQGELNIKSDKMIVYYNKDDKSKDNSKIDHIENIGRVKLQNSGITASAEKTNYSFKNNKIYMYNNVKLIKDKNVIHGNNLVYDLKTGTAKLMSNEQKNNKTEKERVKILIDTNN